MQALDSATQELLSRMAKQPTPSGENQLSAGGISPSPALRHHLSAPRVVLTPTQQPCEEHQSEAHSVRGVVMAFAKSPKYSLAMGFSPSRRAKSGAGARPDIEWHSNGSPAHSKFWILSESMCLQSTASPLGAACHARGSYPLHGIRAHS